jgi:hypothetical protein
MGRHHFVGGDEISFYPCAKIDHYESINQDHPHCRHIWANIYAFQFKPITRVANFDRPDCYHYFLEISSGFIVFHYNWTKPYDEYLQLGVIYQGYGRFTNCGNDESDADWPVDLALMKPYLKTGKLVNVYENALVNDDSKHPYTGEDIAYSPEEEALKRLDYFGDFDKFIKAVTEYELLPLSEFPDSRHFNLIYQVAL